MKTFRIYKTHFESAHYIKDHPKCGVKHGHSYQLLVKVKGDLNEFIDFHDISNEVESLLNEKYDHKDLGNATAEQIIQNIHKDLSRIFNVDIDIELFETAKFGVAIVSD